MQDTIDTLDTNLDSSIKHPSNPKKGSEVNKNSKLSESAEDIKPSDESTKLDSNSEVDEDVKDIVLDSNTNQSNNPDEAAGLSGSTEQLNSPSISDGAESNDTKSSELSDNTEMVNEVFEPAESTEQPNSFSISDGAESNDTKTLDEVDELTEDTGVVDSSVLNENIKDSKLSSNTNQADKSDKDSREFLSNPHLNDPAEDAEVSSCTRASKDHKEPESKDTQEVDDNAKTPTYALKDVEVSAVADANKQVA